MGKLTKYYGWADYILIVDLTDKKITKLDAMPYGKDYIGGVGLNAKLFWDLTVGKGIDPSTITAFDPRNPLLISTGPFVATLVPTGARAEVCGIAPQSDPENYTYSGFGGDWAAQLKFAGYNGIAVTGKSDEPVYILIDDDDVEILDASKLWGADTFRTQETLRKMYPGSSVLTIGPAGENLSRIAIILNKTANAAGQGGFGAVMGSKKLKAIVVRGTGTVGVADGETLLELREIHMKYNPGIWAGHDGGLKMIAGEYVSDDPVKGLKQYFVKSESCFGCPHHCQGFYDVPRLGKCAGMCDEWSYGGSPRGCCSPKQWVPKAHTGETVFLFNILTNKLGVNNLEVRTASDFLFECNEAGLFSPDDIGLPTPVWMKGGKAEDDVFIKTLITGIAYGENIFYKGVARAARELSEKYGKKVWEIFEILYNARGYEVHWTDTIGGFLAIATDTRDAMDSIHDVGCTGLGLPSEELSLKAYGTIAAAHQSLHEPNPMYEGMEKVVVISQHCQRLVNSLTMCEYLSPTLQDMSLESKFYTAVTGISITREGLEKIGERIFNLERAINILHNNRSRKDDHLYDMQYGKHVHYGSAGPPWYDEPWGPDRDKYEKLLDRYYKLRGWDVSTGWPTREKLEELGLKYVADTLESVGKLP